MDWFVNENRIYPFKISWYTHVYGVLYEILKEVSVETKSELVTEYALMPADSGGIPGCKIFQNSRVEGAIHA